MRTVSDDSGKRYLLLERSGDASRVRDPDTGDETYVENDRLDPVEDEPSLETAAAGMSEPVRRVLTAVHDERALGLLCEIVDRGPLSTRQLLDAYDLCESDLHGLLAEFRIAGLVEQRDVMGERGYGATETTDAAIARLRNGSSTRS